MFFLTFRIRCTGPSSEGVVVVCDVFYLTAVTMLSKEKKINNADTSEK